MYTHGTLSSTMFSTGKACERKIKLQDILSILLKFVMNELEQNSLIDKEKHSSMHTLMIIMLCRCKVMTITSTLP